MLIVDDHKVMTEGLVRVLGDRFEIVETVHDGRLVLDAAERHAPAIILLDISMPDVSGVEVLRRLRARGAAARIIVLTMHADPNLAIEALRAGASGFVLKQSSGEELLAALETVLGGGTYLPSELTKDILRLMVGGTDPGRVTLTALQQEVLRLIVRGLRAKEIASTLQVSMGSILAAKYKTMQLLHVRSTAELIRYAVEHRLVSF
jgi:DNA-binding NarL/FixJ family response regulator